MTTASCMENYLLILDWQIENTFKPFETTTTRVDCVGKIFIALLGIVFAPFINAYKAIFSNRNKSMLCRPVDALASLIITPFLMIIQLIKAIIGAILGPSIFSKKADSPGPITGNGTTDKTTRTD